MEQQIKSGKSKNTFEEVYLETKKKVSYSKVKKGVGYALKNGQYTEGNIAC